jgi:hypothetical protein
MTTAFGATASIRVWQPKVGDQPHCNQSLHHTEWTAVDPKQSLTLPCDFGALMHQS